MQDWMKLQWKAVQTPGTPGRGDTKVTGPHSAPLPSTPPSPGVLRSTHQQLCVRALLVALVPEEGREAGQAHVVAVEVGGDLYRVRVM